MAIELDTQFAFAYMSRGNFLDQIGNQQEALLDFNKVIELDPYDACIYNNSGLLFTYPNCSDFYFDRGNQSIIFYEQIMNNRHLQIMIKRWNEIPINLKHITIEVPFIIQNRKHRHCTYKFNKQFELNSNDDYTYNNRGMLYQNIGKIMEALEDYNKAIELDPNIAQIYCSRALLHLSLENKDQAIIDHNKAINQILKMLQIILTEDCFIDI
ncbi:unnamed protein product [Paramecium pentaurelia]|uniref:Tetratricopeptide repeat protein n=1 Tax=Paramecium pentaurelia TaxID=43138 RepID=A0A8S1YH31_9CILI|nr:unnamed protein product [Paramecium pentaurelia]